MTKQCIKKTKLDLDYQRVFPEISSYANIWNTSDDKSEEDEPTVSTSKDLILYSQCTFLSFWNSNTLFTFLQDYYLRMKKQCV